MRYRGLILLVVGLSALAAGTACARDALTGIASRGTTSVAVGDSGRILYSPQAPHVTWFAANPATIMDLNAVAIGANDYIAVGDRGMLFRSADGTGVTWLPRSSRTTKDLFGVHNTATRVVAVGDSGVITYSATLSSDNWTLVASRPTRKALRSISAGGSQWAVAVGDSGTIIWAPASPATVWYLASTVPTTENLRSVSVGWGNSPQFWAVGEGGVILRSTPNAQVWTELVSPVTTDLNGVVFEGLIGIAVGDGGTILYSNGGSIWTKVETPTMANLYAVAHTGSGAGGGFVAVGEDQTILWSALGTAWELKPVPVKKTSWGAIRGGWGPARPGR
jgi:photosystem II stability/assembly factor-like uncharacterized protein